MKPSPWLHIRGMVAETEDSLCGCCRTQHRADQSPLNVNQNELILQRDTQGKPLENWHRVLNVYFLLFMKNHIKS